MDETTNVVDTSQEVEGSEVQTPPTIDFKGTKHKVKIDGTESEIDYDELVKGYQLEKAAQKRLQEVAEQRKQMQADLEMKAKYENLLTALQKNPEMLWQVAEKLGHNPKALAAKLVQQEYELAQMTPEQRELHYYKQQEAQRQEQEAKRQQEEAKLYEQYVGHQYAATIDQEVGELLQQGEQIPPRLLERTIEYMQRHLDVYGKPMPYKKAHFIAKRDIENERRELLQSLDPDSIPQEVREKLRKQELAKLKQLKTPVTKNESFGSQKPGAPKPTADDYFKSMEYKYNKRK